MIAPAIPQKRDGQSRRQRIASRSILGRLIIISCAIIVALLAALLIAMFAIDAGMGDRVITAWASRKLGRAVHLEGLHAELLGSAPGLQIQSLSIANPAWAGGGDFAELHQVSARVQPWSFLTGTLQVPIWLLER